MNWVFLLIAVFCGLDKDHIYNVFESRDSEQLQDVLTSLEGETSDLAQAFLSTTRMMLADHLKKPRAKLRLFKQGATDLDNLITRQPNIIEYRFMRLMIQENAPKITRYKKNIQEDKTFLVQHFASGDFTTKDHIRKYAKRSNILDVESFIH